MKDNFDSESFDSESNETNVHTKISLKEYVDESVIEKHLENCQNIIDSANLSYGIDWMKKESDFLKYCKEYAEKSVTVKDFTLVCGEKTEILRIRQKAFTSLKNYISFIRKELNPDTYTF